MILLLVLAVGLTMGSFANVLAYRLPLKKSLWSRSACLHCHTPLAWYDLIPVLGYLILKGRCRHCRQPISWQYPVIELATACLFLFCFMQDVTIPEVLRCFILIFSAMVIIPADIRYFKIPTLPILLIILAGFISSSADKLPGQMAASVAIFIILFCFGAIGWLLPSRKFGFGMGDLKLAAAIAWTYGQAPALLILLASITLGACIGLGLLCWKRTKINNKIPFGAIIMFIAIFHTFAPDIGRTFYPLFICSMYSFVPLPFNFLSSSSFQRAKFNNQLYIRSIYVC
jgi:leader peptidase (prepilin peptidase) / N-methyltransferase